MVRITNTTKQIFRFPLSEKTGKLEYLVIGSSADAKLKKHDPKRCPAPSVVVESSMLDPKTTPMAEPVLQFFASLVKNRTFDVRPETAEAA